MRRKLTNSTRTGKFHSNRVVRQIAVFAGRVIVTAEFDRLCTHYNPGCVFFYVHTNFILDEKQGYQRTLFVQS